MEIVRESFGYSSGMRLLIVEDDPDLAPSLIDVLTRAGFSVDHVADGQTAIDALAAQAFDLMVLDLGLPRMSGLDVLRRMRSQKVALPVLVLTARDTLDDRVQGLNLGADDYLTKPFELAELEARIRALLRRSAGATTPEIHVGELAIDPTKRTARFRGELVSLSPREIAVLELLAVRAGDLVTKDRIVNSISSWSGDFSENSAEVYVHKLRKKLVGMKIEIVTMRGFGYVLRQTPE